MTLIPAEALARHIAILGSTGSGKTSVAKTGIVEPILSNGGRVLMIDPTGAWWGLRLTAKGGKGFPVHIFGGDHADHPLKFSDAEVLAEAFGTSSDSAIFDTSHMTVTDRSKFFIAFANSLLRRNKGPLNLVIDEAHLFMPQAGAKVGGLVPEMLHAGNNLVSLGRSKGLRVTLISQRPAKLHKDSLTQAQSLIAMRVLSPQDRKAIEEWMDGNGDPVKSKQIAASLSSLKAGEAWVWAPLQESLERVRFPLPKTFDSSKAPDEMSGSGPQLAPLDMGSLKERLSHIEAETKANDPKALKAEIATLKRELASKPVEKINMPDQKAMEDAKQIFHDRGYQLAANEAWADVKIVQKFAEKFHAAYEAFVEASNKLAENADRRVDVVPVLPRYQNIATAKPVAKTQVSYAQTMNGHGEPMPGPHRKLLTVLAQFPQGRTKRQLAILAGYAHNGGAFNNPLANLRSRGWAEGGSERIVITDAGAAALGSWEPLPQGEDLRDYWFGNLAGPPAKILRALCESYPDGMSKADLAKACGYKPSGGAFNNPLARLRSLELVTGKGGAEIRASEDLF